MKIQEDCQDCNWLHFYDVFNLIPLVSFLRKVNDSFRNIGGHQCITPDLLHIPSHLQRTQQQLIQVKSIEEFGIFGIIPASLMISKVSFLFPKFESLKNPLRKSFAAAE